MSLALVPMSIQSARQWVTQHHRHALPPRSGLFAVGVTHDNELVGVGIAGRPVARALDDAKTIEITRIATNETPNACSKLYGALTRAAKALGYQKAITYTLQTEPGTSLKASGWTHDANLPARSTWDSGNRYRYQTDLFGNPIRDPGPKQRWIKHL